MLEKNYDVAIIGAGPAGISAAIYLKRSGINPIMFEKDSPGGTLNRTSKIENYPGFVDEDGTVLAFRMYSQIEELKINLKLEEIVNIEQNKNVLKLITSTGIVYNVNYIIIATGKIPRKLNVPGAIKYDGKGISYCAICDGKLYQNKIVTVIGGGNSALQAANYLSNVAKKVYIINRSLNLRADEKNKNETLSKSNIEIFYNTKVTAIKGDGQKVTKIIFDKNELKTDAIFVCIGQEFNSNYYRDLNLKSDGRGLVVKEDMKTSNSSVYACGDAISKGLYQVVTATAEGAIAATNILKEIKKK